MQLLVTYEVLKERIHLRRAALVTHGQPLCFLPDLDFTRTAPLAAGKYSPRLRARQNGLRRCVDNVWTSRARSGSIAGSSRDRAGHACGGCCGERLLHHDHDLDTAVLRLAHAV